MLDISVNYNKRIERADASLIVVQQKQDNRCLSQFRMGIGSNI